MLCAFRAAHGSDAGRIHHRDQATTTAHQLSAEPCGRTGKLLDWANDPVVRQARPPQRDGPDPAPANRPGGPVPCTRGRTGTFTGACGTCPAAATAATAEMAPTPP